MSLVCGVALAYDAGGHHDTLTRIYYETIRSSAPDPYRVIEAFCAYLPDLSIELDAITQRWKAGSVSASEWTFSEECGQPAVKNMVTTHFYLHALTGTSTIPVRQAAREMIADIDAEIARSAAFNPNTATLQERFARVNLWCERGFATHLLGDTYAHAKLDDPAVLYPTGKGHFFQRKTPDRMLSRDRRPTLIGLWMEWVEEAYTTVLGGSMAPPVRSTFQNAVDRFKVLSEEKGEDALVAFLRVGPDSWNIYPPSRPVAVWGALGLRQPFAPANCQAQIDAGPAAEPNGAGGPAAYGVRPHCATVWTHYLGRALKHFGNIKPEKASCQTTDPMNAPLGGAVAR